MAVVCFLLLQQLPAGPGEVKQHWNKRTAPIPRLRFINSPCRAPESQVSPACCSVLAHTSSTLDCRVPYEQLRHCVLTLRYLPLSQNTEPPAAACIPCLVHMVKHTKTKPKPVSIESGSQQKRCLHPCSPE